MERKETQEERSVRLLNKKSACSVSESARSIRINSNQSDLGIGSWGKVDYLVNYCGYRVSFDRESPLSRIY